MTSGKYLTAETKARISELLDNGITVTQIAIRLGLTPATVSAYNQNKKKRRNLK